MRHTGGMTEVPAATEAPSRLVSGEAVALDVRVARLGSRAIAFVLDLFVIALTGFVVMAVSAVALLFLLNAGAADLALQAAITTIDVVIVFVAVPAAIETWTNGRSLGKVAMGLRVVRDDGGPIRFRQALVRACGLAIEFPGLLLPGFTWFAAVAVMLLHPSGKRFGDLAAGTIVIHERTPDARMWVPAMPPGMGAWAATADLTKLDDELALAIRHFLARNHEIAEPARTAMGRALATELSSSVVPGPPPGTPGWAFLAAVLAERYRRALKRLAVNRKATGQIWETLYGSATPVPQWSQPLPPMGNPPPAVAPHSGPSAPRQW